MKNKQVYYSTADHIYSLSVLTDFYSSVKGRKLYATFVDYKKDFDTVNRANLWSKLIANGISGKLFDIIKDMYSKVKCRVKIAGSVSEPLYSNIGVMQGENLSPLLFAIFINDMICWFT